VALSPFEARAAGARAADPLDQAPERTARGRCADLRRGILAAADEQRSVPPLGASLALIRSAAASGPIRTRHESGTDACARAG
jgi:hypothetical protein